MRRAATRNRDEPMTLPEIHATLAHLTGLPCPAPDAPNQFELWAQYEVASNFCAFARWQPDTEQARRDAVEFTLKNQVYPLEMTRPHIERGLGRELTEDEIAIQALIF